MQAKSTQARGIKAIAAAALLAIAAMVSVAAPASAAPNYPSTNDPSIEIPNYQPPAYATAAISPQQGLAGSAVSVKLTFTPLGVCGWPAIALRTKPGPIAGSTIVSLSLSLTKQLDGSYTGTLLVPQLAVPGTTYYADGGCVGSTYLLSPPVPFVVKAPDVRAVPPGR